MRARRAGGGLGLVVAIFGQASVLDAGVAPRRGETQVEFALAVAQQDHAAGSYKVRHQQWRCNRHGENIEPAAQGRAARHAGGWHCSGKHGLAGLTRRLRGRRGRFLRVRVSFVVRPRRAWPKDLRRQHGRERRISD